MKHILQWKLIVIMFVSTMSGVFAMGLSQFIVYGSMQGMTPEEAEEAAAVYSWAFDIVFVVVTIVVFLLLSRKLVKCIETMNRNVEQIATGQLLELAEDKRKDELGNLSRNINRMAERIASSIEKERAMVCNVAHDLRTPVTSIQGYASLLEKHANLSEEEQEYVSIIKRKSENLSEQIEELLEYSVLQFEEKEYRFEPLSIKRLLEQVLIEFIPMFDQNELTFSTKGNQYELMHDCNQMLMVRLFENLLTNCVRYAKKQSEIEIVLEETAGEMSIAISNFGNTLSKEETESLFEAFYQGKSAAEYKTQSKGLGLAIAKKIVLLHNGTIRAFSDENEQRITFFIKFKK